MGHSSGLGNLLRRLTCSHVRLADIELEGLFIDISYCGELLNAHQDVDRYRNVLICAHASTPFELNQVIMLNTVLTY